MKQGVEVGMEKQRNCRGGQTGFDGEIPVFGAGQSGNKSCRCGDQLRIGWKN